MTNGIKRKGIQTYSGLHAGQVLGARGGEHQFQNTLVDRNRRTRGLEMKREYVNGCDKITLSLNARRKLTFSRSILQDMTFARRTTASTLARTSSRSEARGSILDICTQTRTSSRIKILKQCSRSYWENERSVSLRDKGKTKPE